MSYKIVKKPLVWWPVKIDVAVDGGAVETHMFDLRFRRMKSDELQALKPELEAAMVIERDPQDHSLPVLYAQLVALLATDWRGVLSENDEPLAWDVPDDWATTLDADGKRAALDAPNLTAMMREPDMFVAIYNAFLACMNARAEIRAGN